jgi:hypothetical protein
VPCAASTARTHSTRRGTSVSSVSTPRHMRTVGAIAIAIRTQVAVKRVCPGKRLCRGKCRVCRGKCRVSSLEAAQWARCGRVSVIKKDHRGCGKRDALAAQDVLLRSWPSPLILTQLSATLSYHNRQHKPCTSTPRACPRISTSARALQESFICPTPNVFLPRPKARYDTIGALMCVYLLW